MEFICVTLTKLRSLYTNLTKLSLKRRTSETLKGKLNECNIIYREHQKIVDILEKEIKNCEINSSDVIIIRENCTEINNLYSQIHEFCNQYIGSIESNLLPKMDKFDLKTAIMLLPEMNGDECVTKKLINCIEMYQSMIDSTTEPQLIKFVLTSRLSESAKMRLSQNYSTCNDLISDMKAHLLTKRSSNAIHLELMKMRQNDDTVEDYGKKIEDLFINLTISQADGKADSFQTLKPINEKLAIHRFTDGLRSRELSVILAARNYSELKDVIRAAKDEEASGNHQSTSSVFAGQTQRGYPGRFGSRNFYSNRYPRARGHFQRTNNWDFNGNPGGDNRNGFPSRYQRGGRGGYNDNYRGRYIHAQTRRINCLNETDNSPNEQNLNSETFFRD